MPRVLYPNDDVTVQMMTSRISLCWSLFLC